VNDRSDELSTADLAGQRPANDGATAGDRVPAAGDRLPADRGVDLDRDRDRDVDRDLDRDLDDERAANTEAAGLGRPDDRSRYGDGVDTDRTSDAAGRTGANLDGTGPAGTGPAGAEATGDAWVGATGTGPAATGPTATGPTATGPTATGPTAAGTGPGGSEAADVGAADVGGAAGGGTGAGVTTGSGSPTGADGPLMPPAASESFRARWTDVQTGFVDEPRRAVEQADALVAELMQHLAKTFADERSRLESQWDSGDDVATDDLRTAFQRYRSFFERLLST
jgi:hypothetical protein